MNTHYVNLEEPVVRYFSKLGKQVEIEPSGSRGPDLKSTDGSVVGEIKHAVELARDFPSASWSNWNNAKLRFGGKEVGETLVDMERLGTSVERLSAEARGFVATILGQLKHAYVMKSSLDNGWLVIEDVAQWMVPLKEALLYISNSHSWLSSGVETDEHGIGYVNIRFI